VSLALFLDDGIDANHYASYLVPFFARTGLPCFSDGSNNFDAGLKKTLSLFDEDQLVAIRDVFKFRNRGFADFNDLSLAIKKIEDELARRRA
jgi:hypothetical protein